MYHPVQVFVRLVHGSLGLRRPILILVIISWESIAMLCAAGVRSLCRAAVVIGCLAALAGPISRAADVAVPPDAARDPTHGADAVRSRGFLFEELPTPSCHASTIVEAEPGVFVAAWFGGTREGDPDVGIWVSLSAHGVWSRPEQLATWHDAEGRQQPCWNPVLFRLSDGKLALFYKAGVSPQAWQGLVRRSADGGKTWGEPETIRSVSGSETALRGGPVGPIKNKPVTVDGGVIIAASSTEDAGWRVHFERSTDGGETWQVIGPVNDGTAIGAIQPSILRLGGTRLLALGRTQNNRIFRIESPDDGLTWGAMTLTDVPNPNSGTDAVTLADGRHLLIYNHTEQGRSPLNVALSEDGKKWTPVVTLETEPGEYSYPAIIQASDGMVHVTYTWNRKKIAHAVLDPQKLVPAELGPAKLRPAASAAATPVPGVVIDHVPARTQQFVGSPTIAILPDGTYVAAHDFFGPKSTEWKAAITDVFASDDRGTTWRKISRVEGAFWSNLFVHDGALYLMGPTKHHGPLVIRRSVDGGRTWTTPADAKTGLLADGQFHTAPMPVLVHGGRLWRAVEDASGGKEWGKRYMAMMASVPVDADLLDRGSWTFSNALPRDPSWLDGSFTGWLEGNAVATADGRVLDILRVAAGPIEKAAIVSINADGTTASFEPTSGFIDLPGAATKFTIRRDPRTESAAAKPVWWMLSNAAPPAVPGKKDWSRLRNTLGLLRSEDLRTWELRSIILHHPERERHGFQYVDWLFDGDDVVAVSRTAFDDAEGGARTYHDANYLSFHRVRDFRARSMADSCVDPKTLGW